MFYTAGSTIARKGETADCLAIIVSGRVRIFLPGRTGPPLLTLGPGYVGDSASFKVVNFMPVITIGPLEFLRLVSIFCRHKPYRFQ